MGSTVKSILRWAGSKRSLLPTVDSLYEFSRSRRYVEPFCGSAVLPLNIQPTNALISDINEKLINFFREFRRDPDYYYDRLNVMPASEDFYYRIRSAQGSRHSNKTEALHFLYLNRYCFNGIYRTSKAGHFNVPYGNSRLGALPPRSFYYECAEFLRRTDIIHDQYDNVVSRHLRAGDFVYLDPPYSSENQRIFHQYDPTTFGRHDLDRLAEVLDEIDDADASFVLSYADVPEVDFIKRRWGYKIINVRRSIAGNHLARKKVQEVLITNVGIDAITATK
ncbi:MAG: Dam family site-specific DNA-(adenine-N6)-methyltransferase [Pseudomonadota bacterium]